MELLLWRWSTTAQITSAVMIAVFFVVLARSLRRNELTAWVVAWLANLGALAVTSIFWLAQPTHPLAFLGLRWGYFFSKTMFAVCLAAGAASFVRGQLVPIGGRLTAAVAIFAAAAAFFADGISWTGTIQSAVIAIMFGSGAVILFLRRIDGSEWLATGFTLRTVLALIETFAYATRLGPNRWSGTKSIDLVLASHSSFDTGAEWAIALGCVLMLHRRIQRELSDANRELVDAKEVLQGLIERDPLTGLANRRALSGVFRGMFHSGATIFFFDLNDFKQINDSHGHDAGDQCLKRFAEALRGSYRPEDHVIRFAGDEFIVVAPGVEPAAVSDRTDMVRERLRFGQDGGPEINFSVGSAYLPPGASPDAALKAADEAMYRDKALARSRSHAVTR